MNGFKNPAGTVTIAGAGLAGTLLALLLAQRGQQVRVIERLPDMRREDIPAGRSINLALAARGIQALEMANIMEQVRPLLIPMPGRMLHAPDGALTFVPYGQGEHEVIYSVSRPGLNRVLVDAAERAGVQIRFNCSVTHAELDAGQPGHGRLIVRDASGRLQTEPLLRVIGADGGGSVLRRTLVEQLQIACTEDLLEHGYKELRLPPGPKGRHLLDRQALHIWPRGGFMLIALPNVDGSFTVTLFLPLKGRPSFESLTGEDAVLHFFQEHFSDVCALMPGLAREFLARPTGIMGTVRCSRWSYRDRLLLIGDAAHAMTPFHGQGMNCAFEDCRELIECLLDGSGLLDGVGWAQAFRDFEQGRRAHTDAISQMALENYLEMRDTVRDPGFQLRKAVSLVLERRHPRRFVPRYSMVMFHPEIPYAQALERGCIQEAILAELTDAARSVESIDFTRADHLVEARLAPIRAGG